MVRELAVEKNGKWSQLARDLDAGIRGHHRAGGAFPRSRKCRCGNWASYTPEVIERQKWFAFWDAPLNVPGRPGSNAAVDLPRKPEEIQHAWAAFQVTGCQVNTDGARIEVNLPGVSLGLFSGGLRYTVYRGTNLIRQEVIAKTDAPSVAYKFAGRPEGFRDRQRHAPGVARCRARLAALSVRRRGQYATPWR